MPDGRRLRIGLVCPYSFESPGGVQAHVLGLARYLSERGHDPYVLAPGELSEPAARVLHPDRFTTAGAAVPVRYNGSVARVNFGPLSAARVRRWLREHAFDLLHLHEPVTPSISLLALWAADQPVVATFHTATPRSRSMQLAGGVLRAAIEKLDAGIAVSESARLVVIQHLGRDALVIPNGLRVADFARAADPPDSGHGKPRLVFLGRTDEPRKGLDVLLDAVPAIRAAVGDLEVVVAGQGHRRLPAWCTPLGTVPDQAKAALLGSADVFVAPHRERESFGIVLLEALASGAPVVASDLPPFVDLLGRGRPGFDPVGDVFRVGDHRALARTVIDVLRHPNPEQTGRGQLLARQYDWSRVGAAVLSVYRATLAASPATPARAAR
ncbi:MAG TPA: glycosyltransferase family 4 protein [Pseudonocardia sp.]|nr:glycosyltransferase family 4 protein [Pseudonocardia sp.]